MGMFLRRGQPPARGIPVSMTGTFNDNYAYASIGDTKYTEATQLKVEAGTVVTVYVAVPGGDFGLNASSCKITLDGETVAGGVDGTTSATYKYTVMKPAVLSFSYESLFGFKIYACAITTT